MAIHNLMEDAATAEISRSQVWQQVRNKVTLADTGNTVTRDLVEVLLKEETDRLRGEVEAGIFSAYYEPAARIIQDICLSKDFEDFLTTPAYGLLNG